MVFENRQYAGQLLAVELRKRNIKPDLIYGLARGGIVVAAEIAAAFKIPLKALVVRKISPPGNPEFAVGAIAAGSAVWWDEDAVKRLRLPDEWRREQIVEKKTEIKNISPDIKFFLTRSHKKNFNTILLVDDGAATGATMMAAVKTVREIYKGPTLPRQSLTLLKLIAALPVASTDAAAKIRHQADKTIILNTDPDLRSVGQYYREFNQVSWDEVKTLLQLNSETYRQTYPRKTPPEYDRPRIEGKRGGFGADL